jgi:hypothetical protein
MAELEQEATQRRMSTEPLPRFACPDWWEKIQAGQTPMADVPLNEARAAKALAFFNRLRLPDVAGNPPLSEACGDWFRDILVAFLASEDPVTKRRLVWELLCMVPKKNSKTTYVAALGLTALFMEEAPNRQMLIVAPSQNISERCFAQAQGMIRLDSRLDAIFKVQDHLKCITRRKTGTALDVKSFDTAIVTGEIPVLTIIDELHELGKKAKAPAVMQQIRGGGITMQGGQVLMITTQSDEQPAGIWKTELKRRAAFATARAAAARSCCRCFTSFRKLQKDQAYWRDPKLGPDPAEPRQVDRSRAPDRGLREQRQGQRSKPRRSGFRSISTSRSASATRPMPGPAPSSGPGRGREITLETSSTLRRDRVSDSTAAASTTLRRQRARPRDKVARLAVLVARVVPRRRAGAPAVDRLAASRLQGRRRADDLQTPAKTSPRSSNDQDGQGARLLGAVSVDPAGLGEMVEALAAIDVTVENKLLVGAPQGFGMMNAIKTAERKLQNGTLRHAKSALMDWCVGNVKIEPLATAIRATKQNAGDAKIDPWAALMNAVTVMVRNPEGAAGGALDGPGGETVRHVHDGSEARRHHGGAAQGAAEGRFHGPRQFGQGHPR